MKKTWLAAWKLLVVLCLALLLSGCGKEYAVRFDGDLAAEQTIRSGKRAEEPQAPAREGYLFLGRFKDVGLTEAWDFAADKVEGDLTLYPAWERDAGDEIAHPSGDKDFSLLRTPGSQESAYAYRMFFLPAMDGVAALTTRIYGASGKTIKLFAENNAVLFTSLKEYTTLEE